MHGHTWSKYQSKIGNGLFNGKESTYKSGPWCIGIKVFTELEIECD